MCKDLDERITRTRDTDKRQMMFVDVHGAAKKHLMVNESGGLSPLPEYRLREWLTHQVGAPRDARYSSVTSARAADAEVAALADYLALHAALAG